MDLIHGKAQALWNVLDEPTQFNPQMKIGDFILFALMVRLGIDPLLDALIYLEPALQRYWRDQATHVASSGEINDDDIPF
jgi:hypothetical protein